MLSRKHEWRIQERGSRWKGKEGSSPIILVVTPPHPPKMTTSHIYAHRGTDREQQTLPHSCSSCLCQFAINQSSKPNSEWQTSQKKAQSEWYTMMDFLLTTDVNMAITHKLSSNSTAQNPKVSHSHEPAQQRRWTLLWITLNTQLQPGLKTGAAFERVPK